VPQLLNQKFESFISVGIDVGADFSEMAMCLPSHSFVEKKTFRIYHDKPDSLEAAVKKIKKAEEDFSMKSKVFMESTGIYHLPLFCYLINHGFDSHIVNPLITNSSRNSGIRKVKNDKVDAKNIAKLGLDPELQASTMPHKLVMNLRNLTREYYSLSDDRSKQVIKLQGQLRIALPQFRGIFSSITGKAAMMVLKTYTSLDSLVHADVEELASKISQASRKGITTARKKAEGLIKAAESAQTFGAGVETNFHLICLSISLIETYDEQIKGLPEADE